MQTTFTARHFKASESLKQYAESEVSRLQKYFDGIVVCDIILSEERNNQIAEISTKVSNALLSARESSEDFYKSIDLALEKLSRQLKRHKAKLRQHSHEKINDALSGPVTIEEEAG